MTLKGKSPKANQRRESDGDDEDGEDGDLTCASVSLKLTDSARLVFYTHARFAGRRALLRMRPAWHGAAFSFLDINLEGRNVL